MTIIALVCTDILHRYVNTMQPGNPDVFLDF